MIKPLVFAITTAIVLVAYLLPTDMAKKGSHIASVQPKPLAVVEALERPQFAVAVPLTVKAVKPPETPVKTSGNCEDWMRQAGVPITNATKSLIVKESGCRPDAVNPSSGACGIPQSLPCSKMKCSLSDPVCQLKWMDTYIKSRYGSWDSAYNTWLSRSPHWY
jgi:hypothetical protein